jgi:hypothetical protein
MRDALWTPAVRLWSDRLTERETLRHQAPSAPEPIGLAEG